MPIKTFKRKALKKLFLNGEKAKIPAAYIKRLSLILDYLDAAEKPEDMNFSGSNFHRLKGKLKKFYSIHVSGNYVVIFRFVGKDADDVDYLDYH